MIAKKHDAKTVAKNLITSHGQVGFQKLIDMFRENVSGTIIGREFNVSRQRVSQWKAALGREITVFETCKEIIEFIDKPVEQLIVVTAEVAEETPA